jgi:hypothetical protein
MRGMLVSERTASRRSVFWPAWRETRWLGHGYAHPPGAKESFRVSFPAGRTVERTTPSHVAIGASSPGTWRPASSLPSFSWGEKGRDPPRLLLSFSFSPLPKSPPYPLHRNLATAVGFLQIPGDSGRVLRRQLAGRVRLDLCIAGHEEEYGRVPLNLVCGSGLSLFSHRR